MELDLIFDKACKYYKSEKTKDIDGRIYFLTVLKNTLQKYEDKLLNALKKDLGKSRAEGFMTELGIVYEEINYFKKNLTKISAPQKPIISLTQFPGKLKVIHQPHGVVLIISPWNYPVNLSLTPLVGAIAGGNSVILKPSEYAPNTSYWIEKILKEISDDRVQVVNGGEEISSELLKKNFGYIFFTGSPRVGKIVMKAAAENLTPITLELGGKSPTIVDENVNIKKTARRIVFGKLLNAGQTCVAPDYVICHKSIKKDLIYEILVQIKKSLPTPDYYNKNFGKIINEKHFNRIVNLIEGNALFAQLDVPHFEENKLKICPVIIDSPSLDSDVMNEEIFGPVLPILTFEKLSDIIDIVNRNKNPLSMYIFSKDEMFVDKIISNINSGGVCINDTIMHMASNKAPFGGVKTSGIGNYHGKASFEAFTRKRTCLYKSNFFDIKFREHPYKERDLDIIRKFYK